MRIYPCIQLAQTQPPCFHQEVGCRCWSRCCSLVWSWSCLCSCSLSWAWWLRSWSCWGVPVGRAGHRGFVYTVPSGCTVAPEKSAVVAPGGECLRAQNLECWVWLGGTASAFVELKSSRFAPLWGQKRLRSRLGRRLVLLGRAYGQSRSPGFCVHST